MRFELNDKVVTENGRIVTIQGYTIHSFAGKANVKYITTGGTFDESTLEPYVEQKEDGVYSFSKVLDYLKSGKKVKRKDWKDTFLIVVYANDVGYTDEFIKRFDCECENGWYIAIKTNDGMLVPWQAGSTSLLANDWIIYEGDNND